MEDLLDITQEEVHLSDKELFINIWTSPRQVFRYINDHNYDKFVPILLVLSGLSRAFDKAASKNLGDTMSIWAILGICIIGGGIFGWLSYYIYARLISWTGKWLKAKGDSRSILRMLSYAMIPSIIALVILIAQISIYGNEIFKSDGDMASVSFVSNIFVYGSLSLNLIFGIWTLVLCVVVTSEVQGISIGKSIINLLLPLVIIFLPILLIDLFSKH